MAFIQRTTDGCYLPNKKANRTNGLLIDLCFSSPENPPIHVCDYILLIVWFLELQVYSHWQIIQLTAMILLYYLNFFWNKGSIHHFKDTILLEPAGSSYSKLPQTALNSTLLKLFFHTSIAQNLYAHQWAILYHKEFTKGSNMPSVQQLVWACWSV